MSWQPTHLMSRSLCCALNRLFNWTWQCMEACVHMISWFWYNNNTHPLMPVFRLALWWWKLVCTFMWGENELLNVWLNLYLYKSESHPMWFNGVFVALVCKVLKIYRSSFLIYLYCAQMDIIIRHWFCMHLSLEISLNESFVLKWVFVCFGKATFIMITVTLNV